jgi:hypothetical protein
MLNYYNTTTCTGTPTETMNVETQFPCSLVGASGAGSAVDTIISANSYMEFNFVDSAANTNVYLNFGVLASLLVVITQLWKN